MSQLTSPKIQLWSPDIMLSLIPLSEAQQLVQSGRAHIINEQAIYRVPMGCEKCFFRQNSGITCKKILTNSTSHLADKCELRREFAKEE